MILHYLVHLARVSTRSRLYTFIHVTGLAIALAASLLIVLFVVHERSYDQHWAKSDNLYQVQTTMTVPGRGPSHATTSMGPAGSALERSFSEILSFGRVHPMGSILSTENNGTKQTFPDVVTFVDPEILEYFPPQLIEGELFRSDQDLRGMIVTQSFAEKYFGSTSPVGKQLSLRSNSFQRDYQVRAVIHDLAENTHLSWSALVLIDEEAFAEQSWRFQSWTALNNYTYVELRNPEDRASIQHRIPRFLDDSYPELPLGDSNAKASDFIHLRLQSIQDIHLHSKGQGAMRPHGDSEITLAFTVIAGFIILIACINFINLSTARSTRRAREVCLRKMLGASRAQLVFQFLAESVFLSGLALICSFSILEIMGDCFGGWMERALQVNFVENPDILLWGAGLALLVGIAGGLYPAFFLSSFRPARVLRANQGSDAAGFARLRTFLVLVQFTISSALIICTTTMFAQTLFAQHKDLGFDNEKLLVVRGTNESTTRRHADTFMESIRNLPGVENISHLAFAPADNWENNVLARPNGSSPEDNALVGYRAVDSGFLDTFGISLLAGRNFSDERSQDSYPTPAQRKRSPNFSASTLINEAALERFGFESFDAALHTQLVVRLGSKKDAPTVRLNIIGVIENIHLDSLRNEIRPELYVSNPAALGVVAIRFSGRSPNALMLALETKWRNVMGDEPFTGFFVNSMIALQYQREASTTRLFAAFSALAVIIASLGLFGLASFTVERRTKEIGVRKVLGASTSDIVTLLLWDFSLPVLVANGLGSLAALFFMDKWLGKFHYHIDLWHLGLPIALSATLITLLIAWGTALIHTLRVARASPIHALRHD